MRQPGSRLFLGKQRFVSPGRKNENNPAKGRVRMQAFPGLSLGSASKAGLFEQGEGQ
jgi:hypothetical protein